MTISNDSILVTPGSGATVATHTINSKEHQATVDVDEYGHITGTAPAYVGYLPSVAAGANKVYFDLFNATGSGVTLRVKSVEVIKDGSVAVTGALSLKLYLTRTTAIGTGGTAATTESTSLTAPGLNKMNPGNPNLPAGVTLRSAPTGGATAGAVIGETHIFPEETNASSYEYIDFLIAEAADIQPLFVPENTGIRVVQGSVASVGNTGFNIIFEAVS